jgi:putative transposase
MAAAAILRSVSLPPDGEPWMARPPRIDIAGMPQHIIQRGNNRNECFFAERDYRRYLDFLKLATRKYGCSIHAYVLMTNHVHLLATGERAGSLSNMMQSLGRRYVRYVNKVYSRTGTLWEGRFRSSLVDSDHYLLACHRYIELNPVRAAVVTETGNYRWSSFAHNARGQEDDVISPHDCYQTLGASTEKRCAAYRRLFSNSMAAGELKLIRDHINQGKVLGSSKFQDRVKSLLGRDVKMSKSGRPKKPAKNVL